MWRPTHPLRASAESGLGESGEGVQSATGTSYSAVAGMKRPVDDSTASGEASQLQEHAHKRPRTTENGNGATEHEVGSVAETEETRGSSGTSHEAEVQDVTPTAQT